MSKKIKDAYKLSSNLYDDVLTHSKWWSKLYIKFIWGNVDDIKIQNTLLQLIDNDFEGVILDVPVGTGIFTVDKYKQLNKATIKCLDYSKDMLDIAKMRFEEADINNIELISGDVSNLPFEDESIDMVISMNGFHVFPNKEKAFSEVFRVLKKGGVFITTFYIKGENRIGDMFVKNILEKKGWFTPPYETFDSLSKRLNMSYSDVKIWNEKSLVSAKCIK